MHHYFIPGAHNAHRPLFLELEAVVVNCTIVVLLFLVAMGLQKLIIRSSSLQVGAVVASVLVDLANADRSEHGLKSLIVSPTLENAAQMKADDMAAKGYFAHDTPEGHTPWYWFEEARYGFRYAGENLAVYFSDSAEVEKAWMSSPLHRANILNTNFSEIGIALAHGTYEGVETTFVVQMFGNPTEVSAAVIKTQETPGDKLARVAGASAEAKALAASATEGTKPIGAVTKRPSSNLLWRILTAPRTTLRYAYMGLAALVLLAIGFLFFVGLRRLHVPGLLRGVGLLVLIGILLWGSISLAPGELLIL